jgi:hypothetical protein
MTVTVSLDDTFNFLEGKDGFFFHG